MTKKRSLSKVAKKIRGDKLFKKAIANWATEASLILDEHDLNKILMYGHRGYLAMSEDELCRSFDKLKIRLEEKYEENKKEGGSDLWGKRLQAHGSLAKLIGEGDEVADTIFEKIILS